MPTYQTVDLIYNQTGQTVYVYPDEWALGVPTSATCAVYKGDKDMDEDPEFSPTVTIDSVSTTIAAAAGPAQSNPRRLVLASCAGIDPGISYLAETDAEQRELVTPTKAHTASAYIDLENELRYDYPASGCTLKGVRMSFTVNADWIANSNNILLPDWPSYKAVWTYTLGGLSRRAYTYLRIVRQVAKTGVTVRDLQKYMPDILLEEPRSQRGQGYNPLIEGAWEDCRRDLLALGREPSVFRDTEILAGLHIRRCLLNLGLYRGVAPGNWDPVAWTNQMRQDYEAYKSEHFGAKTTPKVDETTSGAASVITRHSLWTTG